MDKEKFKQWLNEELLVDKGCLPTWILLWLFYTIFTSMFVAGDSVMSIYLRGFKWGIFTALYVYAVMSLWMFKPKDNQ